MNCNRVIAETWRRSLVPHRRALCRVVAWSLLLLLFSAPARLRADSVLYNNGPDNHDFLHIVTINDSHKASDDFILSSASVLTGVIFAEETVPLGANASLPPAVPSTVQWCIGTTTFGTNVACGTATVTATASGFTSGPFTNYGSEFSLPSLSLGAGTYFLTLGDTTNSDGFHNGYWGTSATSGGDAEFFSAATPFTPATTNDTHEELSFQILGTTASGPPPQTPEPSSLLLVGIGLLALAVLSSYAKPLA